MSFIRGRDISVVSGPGGGVGVARCQFQILAGIWMCLCICCTGWFWSEVHKGSVRQQFLLNQNGHNEDIHHSFLTKGVLLSVTQICQTFPPCLFPEPSIFCWVMVSFFCRIQTTGFTEVMMDRERGSSLCEEI